MSKPRNWYWYKLQISFHQFYMYSYLCVHVCAQVHTINSNVSYGYLHEITTTTMIWTCSNSTRIPSALTSFKKTLKWSLNWCTQERAQNSTPGKEDSGSLLEREKRSKVCNRQKRLFEEQLYDSSSWFRRKIGKDFVVLFSILS